MNIDLGDLKYFFWIADLNDDGKITCQDFIETMMNATES
jgi:Ca2+-binding EF-hand superfamily protein